jgi:hypothetical protein
MVEVMIACAIMHNITIERVQIMIIIYTINIYGTLVDFDHEEVPAEFACTYRILMHWPCQPKVRIDGKSATKLFINNYKMI